MKKKLPGKPGRPKGKPLSPKERAQRQTAALKTGEHSSRVLGRALPPCKPAACPVGEPCETKKEIEAAGGGLAICLRALGAADTVEGFRRAMRDGDTRTLTDLAALSLSGWSVLEQEQLRILLGEGLVSERPIVIGRDQDGIPEMGTVPIENPRVAPLLKVSELLGRSANQQVITPKARGEKAANEGLGKVGQLAWIVSMRKGLTEGRSTEEGES